MMEFITNAFDIFLTAIDFLFGIFFAFIANFLPDATVMPETYTSALQGLIAFGYQLSFVVPWATIWWVFQSIIFFEIGFFIFRFIIKSSGILTKMSEVIAKVIRG